MTRLAGSVSEKKKTTAVALAMATLAFYDDMLMPVI